MYYYPTNVDIDTKIKQVGLCEAIITFTRYVKSFYITYVLKCGKTLAQNKPY